MKFMKLKIICLFVVFVAAYSNCLYSQNVTAEASLEKNSILVGDQIKLKITVKSDTKLHFILPVIPDTIDKIEVVEVLKNDTSNDKGSYKISQNIIITCFDFGAYVIPPFTVTYEKPNTNEISAIQTNHLTLNVGNVNIDANAPFRDIKPPIEEPYTLADYLFYLLFLIPVIVLIAAYIIFRKYWKKRKQNIKPEEKREVLIKKPEIPAHIIALSRLDNLEKQTLWQNGKFKEYHTEISEIIREYIENKFFITALEETTAEIMNELFNYFDKYNKKNFDESQYFDDYSMELLKDNIRKILETADFVKFAKYVPKTIENENVLNLSYKFVNDTTKMNTETAE
jgi:hypothetical protein